MASSPSIPESFPAPFLSHSSSANRVVSRTRCGDLALGIIKSKFFRTQILSGLAVGAFFGVSIFFPSLGLTHPAPWMIAAVATGSFAVGLLIQLPFKGRQKTLFETSAFFRLFNKKNYDEIFRADNNSSLFLGALPNRMRSEGEKLVNNEKVSAVLSVNEPWERKPVGLSLPYSRQDWKDLGILYEGMDVKDHTFLSYDQLDKAADFIYKQMTEGKNVYVHCRAGCGRSAMAVAAYLIKYQGMTVDKAVEHIEQMRPVSTIGKKATQLKLYKQNRLDKQSHLNH